MGPPSHRRSPLEPALALVGAVVLVAGTVQIAMAFVPPAVDPIGPVLLTVVGWVYAAAGLMAWRRRPSNRLGLIMVVGGLAVLATNLSTSQDPVMIALGTAGATAPFAVVVHLLLAFPSGRLTGVGSTVVVIVGYVVCGVLQAPLYLFADRPDLAAAGSVVQKVAGASVLAVTAVMLAVRWRRAAPPQRRVLAPLYAYGILAVPFISLLANVIGPLADLSGETVSALQLLVLALVPVAFASGVLRGGFARTGEIVELGAWLGQSAGARPELEAAIARTLGDASLRLVFWLPDGGHYVDAAGQEVEIPHTGSGRAAAEIDLAGHRIGAIVYDSLLTADPADVQAAGRVVAIAVDHERLTAELLASREALRRSRARIVEAGDRARRRIAQNLHDGIQVRLVLLAMDAQLVAAGAETAATRQAATALRTGIDDAAAELRDLVHDVMPAGLIQRGLAAATEDLLDRVTLPTHLELGVADGVLSPATESAAYFVVAEALTNTLKHSGATQLVVRIAVVEDRVHVEIGDDGSGGAVPDNGLGLRGIVDRVDAAGGTLCIESPVGRGTRILAELPCA